MFFCKGEKISPYFRHKNITKCKYYTNPGESQIHKDAKMMMKYILEKNNITMFRYCDCGCIDDHNISAQDCEILEYRFEYNGPKVADVACIRDNKIVYIFEVYHTNKTKENARPEPWFELNSESIYRAAKNNFRFQCDRNVFNNKACKCKICKRCGNKCPEWVMQTNKVNSTICKSCDIEMYNRYYLSVPYSEKEEAKKLGAEWDKIEKKWYVDRSRELEPFSRWCK